MRSMIRVLPALAAPDRMLPTPVTIAACACPGESRPLRHKRCLCCTRTWFFRKRRMCSTRKRGSRVMRNRRRPATGRGIEHDHGRPPGGATAARAAQLTAQPQPGLPPTTPPTHARNTPCTPALMSSFTVLPSNLRRISKMGTCPEGPVRGGHVGTTCFSGQTQQQSQSQPWLDTFGVDALRPPSTPVHNASKMTHFNTKMRHPGSPVE